MQVEVEMAKNIPKSGKRLRPKTAIKGKRYRCAKCRKRSPRPVKTPAPWYCPKCLEELRSSKSGNDFSPVAP
jgi:ribosomal protein L37AE/L43A